MIYKGRTRYIINAYNINIVIQFISTIIAMQSSVPSLSCLADSNLNMCLQKWFQRKMWNYDKVNNSRSWIFCISITLIKCETVNLFLFSLNTLPNKKMHCCLTGKNDTFKYWLIMSYFVQMVQTAILPHTQPCICKHDKWYLS